MKTKLFLGPLLGTLLFAAAPAFAGSANFSFSFGGPDGTLGTSQSYASNGATVTAFGYVCSAATPSSTDTLSNCSATALYQKSDGPNETGLGLAGQGGGQNEIGWDGPNADYVVGLDVSQLFNLGATSMTLSFGSVQPGEAFAVLGYASDPFTQSSFALTNTRAFVGNDGSTSAQIFSATFRLDASDEYLVLISPCDASASTTLPCGGNITLDSLTATSPTPEPDTLVLLATGLLVFGFAVRRRFANQPI
ncbi:MAG TPA: PEP-CTERM sorting domain-containing protein [Candidatus Acidoferrales bacterium]|nr:PEP-CTERM sorting domain-containing protein [Candidatus Acidoferrales bacterium]